MLMNDVNYDRTGEAQWHTKTEKLEPQPQNLIWTKHLCGGGGRVLPVSDETSYHRFGNSFRRYNNHPKEAKR